MVAHLPPPARAGPVWAQGRGPGLPLLHPQQSEPGMGGQVAQQLLHGAQQTGTGTHRAAAFTQSPWVPWPGSPPGRLSGLGPGAGVVLVQGTSGPSPAPGRRRLAALPARAAPRGAHPEVKVSVRAQAPAARAGPTCSAASLQHGVQLVRQVVEHAADVVQYAAGALLLRGQGACALRVLLPDLFFYGLQRRRQARASLLQLLPGAVSRRGAVGRGRGSGCGCGCGCAWRLGGHVQRGRAGGRGLGGAGA